ncbi:iron hydrogenase [Blastocladiella britannica]|nr:iron hydrogenase [Blastocladiella britannica]
MKEELSALETATISLNDCLACSGCVTSAESVLVAQQSHTQLITHLQQQTHESRPLVVTLSRQSLASLGARHGIPSLAAVARKVSWFCTHVLGADRTLDLAPFRELALREAESEFADRLRKHAARFPAPQLPVEPSEPVVAAAPRRVIRGGGGDGASTRRRRAGQAAGTDPTNAPPDLTTHRLPMLASSCPGWICYAEKTQHWVLPLVAAGRSPQAVAGAAVRRAASPTSFHVAVMPCFDKKLEASRSDFLDAQSDLRDVDCVLATTELDRLMLDRDVLNQLPRVMDGTAPLVPLTLAEFPETEVLDPWFAADTVTGELTEAPVTELAGSSGGWMHRVMVAAAADVFDVDLSNPTVRDAWVVRKVGRTPDVVEWTVRPPPNQSVPPHNELRFAQVYGFTNIQNMLRKLRAGAATPHSPVYHYVEVMACPAGCVHGGGQLPPESKSVTPRAWVEAVERVYFSSSSLTNASMGMDIIDEDAMDVDGPSMSPADSVQAALAAAAAATGQEYAQLMRTEYSAVEGDFAVAVTGW